MYHKHKPDLRERGLRTNMIEKQPFDLLLLSSLIKYLAEFPQENQRGNLGIKKMVPQQYAKY
jgi:hypothetical protein